ncbi:MAG: nucleoside recognition domain-containing protein [Myxococcota bacterium]
MNRIFYGMIAIAIGFAAFRELVWTLQPEALGAWLAIWVPSVAWLPPEAVEGAEPMKAPMDAVSSGLFDAAKASVNLAIGLIGGMAFFLGLMKVAEDAGMLKVIARAVRPVMELLFPDVPADHPAMGAMIMNMSANALGLGNAATPFGIKAMQELDTLNPEKGTATNAMALFLAINTSSVTILPTGVMALRDVMGSTNPAGIMGTTLLATLLSTSAGILAAKLYQRFSVAPGGDVPVRPVDVGQALVLFFYVLGLVVMIGLCIVLGEIVSPWVVPVIVIGILTWGFFAGVPVYESFVEGAKEGFSVASKIIPYLVAILCAVGMLRASGALDVFVAAVGPVTSAVGLPAEALPMALLRPLSGSGAYGVMTEIMQTEGPDSYAGYLVSTLQGSTETTFYVIAVYFGAVQVTRIRHAMAAALTADLVGIIGAILGCQLYFWFNGL